MKRSSLRRGARSRAASIPSRVPGGRRLRRTAYYRALFEQTANGVALHEIVLDAGGRPVDYVFLDVNAAFENLTGLSRAAILGRRVTEVLPGIERDPADWIGRYGRVALTGETIHFDRYAEPLQRWYDVMAYSPRRGLFAVVFSDVTGHKRLEEALRESESRYRMQSRELLATLDATHAQLALLDRELRFVMVNGAYERACGHRREELVGRGHFEFFPHEENERLFRRVVETGEPFYVEEKPFRFPERPDHETYWNWSLVPIRAEGGNVEAVLLSLVDVTAQVDSRKSLEQIAAEREQAASTLRREAELRERFVAILSHDLRSPMGVVRSSVEALLRRGAAPEQRAALERALRATHAMESLVRTLLDYAQIRSGGGIPIAPAPADLAEVCRRVVEDAAASAKGHPIDLRAEGDLSGFWDAERLVQALGNLAANALRYGDGSPVRVAARPDGEGVAVDVANGGAPIPAEALPKLFEPFSRAQPMPSGGRPGLGLGLYIVREIAKAHGGTVSVVSSPGSTVFTLRLPRRAPRS